MEIEIDKEFTRNGTLRLYYSSERSLYIIRYSQDNKEVILKTPTNILSAKIMMWWYKKVFGTRMFQW